MLKKSFLWITSKLICKLLTNFSRGKNLLILLVISVTKPWIYNITGLIIKKCARNIYYFNNTKENKTGNTFVRKLGKKPLYWHFFIQEKTRKLKMGIYRKLSSTK